ncbi:MAG: DnaJ domain-containing protein, partial [Myxococcales bacterium]|nr:DnaJ domain-containing protein [Myxococcales bacterium]
MGRHPRRLVHHEHGTVPINLAERHRPVGHHRQGGFLARQAAHRHPIARRKAPPLGKAAAVHPDAVVVHEATSPRAPQARNPADQPPVETHARVPFLHGEKGTFFLAVHGHGSLYFAAVTTGRKRDYYEVLGVVQTASHDELKRAYRRLAIEFHPDRNPDNAAAEERFKEASEAFSILGNAEKRQRYDRGGHAAVGGSGDEVDFSSITDMLEGLFGEVFGKRRERAGRDIRVDLRVTFEEAVRGAEREILVERQTPTGGVRQRMTVKVPAGVEDGSVRTVRGAGEETAGGAGDLHVYIRIDEHPLFKRAGADVLCTVPVTYPQAVLGAELEVPTVDGTVTMKMPAGTPSGKVFRLRGKGVPIFGGAGKGDQLVTVEIEVPEQVSRKVRQLLEQLAAEMGE